MSMGYSVRMSEFREMSEEKRAEAVGKLVEGAFEAANGQAGKLEAEVEELEHKYGITSERMLEELSEGRLSETDEISDWLWLLNLRGRSRAS